MSRHARKDRPPRKPLATRGRGGSTVRLVVEALEDRTCPTVGHDVVGTAIPIQFDMYHRADAVAALTQSNETDLYQITLSANEPILVGVETQSDGQGLQSALRIFDASGNELVVNSFANSPIVFTASTAGTYYFGVSSDGNVSYDITTASSGSGGTTDGDYRLRIIDASADSDGNTSPGTATDLSFSGNEATAAGSIDSANDVDDYRVYLTQGHQVRVFADLDSNNSLDAYVTITDPTGMQRAGFVDSLTDSSNAPDGAVFTAPMDGYYVIQVRGWNLYSRFGAGLTAPNNLGGSDGPYVLHVVDDPPDLVTTNFQVLSSDIQWGQTIQVRYTITNQGTGDAAPFDVQFRLSASDTFDATQPAVDVAGGGDSVRFASGLAAGQSVDAVVTLQLPGQPPASLANSVYLYLGAVVDSSNEITEASEVNNSAQKSGGDYAPIAITLVTQEAETANSTPGSNNTIGSAETIRANSDVAGTLVAGDVDWYSFTGAAGQLAIDLDSTDSNLAARVALYDSAGDLLIDSDDSPDGSALISIQQDLAAGGLYCVSVSARSGTVGPTPYVLKIREDDASAPNQPLPIPAAAGAYFLVTADLNRDGVPDLIVGSKAGGAVTVYLGDPLGGFGPASTLTGVSAAAAAVGDFNGDGIPDIVVADESSGSVYVLLGRGDGTFDAPSTPVSIALPGGAMSTYHAQLTALDMDGDGNLDVVVSDSPLFGTGIVSVAVAYGNGDGTFASSPWMITGLPDVGAAVADFDNDGRMDIAVATRTDFAHPNADAITLYKNDGHRGFVPTTTIALDGSPTAIAVADFNGDGNLDLAVTEQRLVSGVETGAVAVFLGGGGGTFGSQAIYSVGDDPEALAVGDANADHRTDLIVANNGSNDVSVLMNLGGGMFASEQRFDTGSAPTALALADFDSDGTLDIATADSGSDDIRILRGRGDGDFVLDDPFRAGTGPVSLADGDFNRDGFLDVVTVNPVADTLSILLNRGDGTFVAGAVYATGAQPKNVAVGDLNGDGRLDLVVTDSGSDAISVYLGLGDGTFTPERRIAVGFAPDALTLADLNNDGHLDLVLVGPSGTTVAVFLGLGDGGFGAPTTYSVGPAGFGLNAPSIVAADFNGDGRLDLAIDNSTQVTALYGDPSAPGTFEPAVTVASGPTGRLSVGDINGDGLPDLIVSSQIDPTEVYLSLGYGIQGFAAPSRLLIDVDSSDPGNPVFYSSFVLADFDGDGIPDLVTANSSTLGIAAGLGNGTFQPLKILASGDFSGDQTLLVGDFNHDGHLDLLGVNQNNDDLTVDLGLGNGTYSDVSTIGGAQRLSQPIVEDIDSDGFVDSFALSQTGQILFRHGQAGDTPFAPPTVVNSFDTARAFTTLTIGSRPAVAVANTDSDTVTIYVDNFGFWSPISNPIATGALPSSILAADLDGDGLDDLVIADNLDDTVTVAYQQPDGTFAVLTPIAVGVAPSDLAFAASAVGPQVIVSDRGSGDVSVLTFAANGSITSTRFRAGGGQFDETPNRVGTEVVHSLNLTTDVAVGNFDADAYPDVIAVNQAADSFSVLRGDPDGGFSDPTGAYTFPAGDSPSSVVVGDFNGDGHDDLAVLMEGTGEVWIYLGDGHGGFTHTSTIPVGNAPNGLTSFREPSGRIDLQVANAFGDILDLQGDGHGNFAIDRTGLDHVALAVADLSGHGDQDVVVANQSLDHVEVLLRDPGQDAFQTSQTFVTGTLTPGAVAITDLNGDGLPDMIVANELGNDVLVYLGLAGGLFGAPQRYDVGFDPVGITVGDLNGDGVADLAIPNEGSNDISILFGKIDSTSGAWSADLGPRVRSGGTGPLSVSIADVNHDGIPDLVVANQNGRVTSIPGTGGGFFNDTVDSRGFGIEDTISQVSGDLLVTGRGNILQFDPKSLSFVTLYDGGGAVAAFESDGVLVAGFADQTVGILEPTANGLFGVDQIFEGITNEVSALAVLEMGGSFEVYVSQVGLDVPTILTASDFTSLITVNLPNTEIETIATTSGDGDLTVIAAISFKTVPGTDESRSVSESTSELDITTVVDHSFGILPTSSDRAIVQVAFLDADDMPNADTYDLRETSLLPLYEEYQLNLQEYLRDLMRSSREMNRTEGAQPESSSSAPVTDSGLSRILPLEPTRVDPAKPASPHPGDVARAAEEIAPVGTPGRVQPSIAFLGLALLTYALQAPEPRIAIRRTAMIAVGSQPTNRGPAERPRRRLSIRIALRRTDRRTLRRRFHDPDSPRPNSL